MTVEIYEGYGIDFNIYGEGEYSVQICGDDFLFSTIEEAREFIDTEIGYEILVAKRERR